MTIDVILTLITLVVAVVGTALDKPPKLIKVFLIALALATSIGSIVKAHDDAKEKEFLKTALISNLVPNGKVYGILAEQVADEAREQFGLPVPNCYHSDDGMTCFFASSRHPLTRATAVFNRLDISDLYANYIQRRSSNAMIHKIFNEQYKPEDLSEDFEEKAAILGLAVLYRHFHLWPAYSYDDHGGQDLELIYTAPGINTVLRFSPTELASIGTNAEPTVFYEVEQQIRKKLLDQGIQTASDSMEESH